MWARRHHLHSFHRRHLDAEPQLFVPPQFHSARKVRRGDVVFCELSGVWWITPGRCCAASRSRRTDPLYRDLHAARGGVRCGERRGAHGTTMQAIVDAAGVIESAASRCATTCARLRGGYFQPIVGTKSARRPLPDMTLQETYVVVQRT